MRPAKREQSTAWQLRTSWAKREAVRLTLTPRCMIRTVVGEISTVAATGAFVVIDGWHIPTVEIDAVGKPTIPDKDGYAKAMEILRASGDLEPKAEAA